MSLLEGIGAVGEGLSKEMGTLTSAAREQRALQSSENQYKTAVSAQALEEFKKNQQKFSIDDLSKVNPYAPFMIQEAKNDMTIMPDQTHITLGEAKEKMKTYLSDETKMIPWTQILMDQKTQEAKAAETSLSVETEKLKKLQEDPLGNKDKIADTQGKIQQYSQVLQTAKQQEGEMSGHLDKLEIQKAQKYRANLKGQDALAWDAVLEKNKSAGKTGKNLVPTAVQVEQETQDLKYQEKTSEMKNFEAEAPSMKGKLGTEEYGKALSTWRKKQAQEKQDAASSGLDIPDLAQSIKNGEASLSQIKNTKGMVVSNKVMSEVRKEFPHYNFIYQDANAKYITSTANQRILGAVDASLPRINMLAAQAENLKNSDIPSINAVMKQILTQTGSPTYTNFESNRNAIVQEVNTALSGSSQSSDMRVQIELENLKSSRSPAQLLGSISNLREALLARRDASQQYIYPMEVVTGEKTLGQWKKETEAKYRGKYGSNKPAESGMTESSARESLNGKGYSKEDIDKYIEKAKASGKITSQSDNGRVLAQVEAKDIPMGTGTANQAKSIMQLQKEANDALKKEDYSKYEEINKQIQDIVNQRKQTG